MIFGSSFKMYAPPITLGSLAMLLAAQTFWVPDAWGLSSGHKEHKSGPATATAIRREPLPVFESRWNSIHRVQKWRAVFSAALAESGQIEEGLQHMRKAVELSPDFARAHSYLGTALAKTGRFEEAIEQMRAAINLVPNSSEYEFNLGFIRKLGGDYAGAAAAFEKSVEASPPRPQKWPKQP